ncbi:ABC transporter permease [Acidobacteriota bacterium]
MNSVIRKEIRLPNNLTINEVPGLYSEIQREGKFSKIILDFADLEKCDQAGLVLLSYLQRNRPHVVFNHVQERFINLISECSPVEESIVPIKCRPNLNQRMESFSDRFLESVQNVCRYFSLLADEIFYSIQYLRKRRGLYPGEISNQLLSVGYKSFPIVCLITFLVGVTISLSSAAQLKLFGADIYLAYFIGFAMIRELVPLMTGIILAGKVGAAMTAEISTMMVLEEIDALKTIGIAPVKFLMVPRLLAMTMAIPLLVGLADCVGIFGGVLVARFFLGTPISVFLREMFTIVHFDDFVIGLLKTLIFGWTIVISSGFKGFSVRFGAEEVGRATTESVVLSITLIIFLDCIFALFLY